MPIIQPAPNTVRECSVYKELLQKATPGDGLVAKADRLIETATPLLDLIVAGPFREFTLHNRDHAKKVLHLTGQLAGPETASQLSRLECLILIFAAYLHDLGMTVTWKERERILDSTEFIETLADWQELSNMLSMARSQISKLDSAVADKMLSAEEAERQRLRVETEIHQLQEAALCAYLRPRHAMRARYVELAEQLKRDSGMSELFSFQGVSFLEPLISICWSHNEDPAVLAEVKGPYEDTFPRDLTICGEVLNTQFCAALLRLADIMDFDRERTPRVLFEALGIASRSVPSAEVTLREWSKHLSVHTIETRDDEILISAVCEHPVIECAVREFCRSIERELRDTAAVLKRNPAHIAARYALNLPVTVRPRIQPQGYV